jgi:hypothetical protein
MLLLLRRSAKLCGSLGLVALLPDCFLLPSLSSGSMFCYLAFLKSHMPLELFKS